MTDCSDLNISNKSSELEIEEEVYSKLGISLLLLKKELCNYIINNAESLSKEIKCIFPYGDYSKIIEDKKEMAVFLAEDASKHDNWKLYSFSSSENLLNFTFSCLPVNEDHEFKGHVFVSLNGKIKHVFASNDD